MIPLHRTYPLGGSTCCTILYPTPVKHPKTGSPPAGLPQFSPATLWFYDVEAREPTVKAARADMAPMGSIPLLPHHKRFANLEVLASHFA